MTTAQALPRGRAAVALARALVYAVLIVVVFYVVPLRMAVEVRQVMFEVDTQG